MPVPKNIHQLNRFIINELVRMHPEEEASAISRIILQHLFQITLTDLLRTPETPVTPSAWSKVKDILSELKLRKPVQYILGETEFYGCRIKVNPDVLIPRPETEELVRWVIQEAGNLSRNTALLDIGTGSGCIAIALAKNLPETTVSACDISSAALATASGNAIMNHADVQFFSMDILCPPAENLEKKYDIIVSNPPYVPENEKAALEPEVIRYEPARTLFVPSHNPLVFYRAILEFAKQTLNEKGRLFFEIHPPYAGEIEKLFREYGFSNVQIRKDINDKERMAGGTLR